MSLDYKVIIQEEKPALTVAAYLWINPAIGTAFIKLNDWIIFASGEPQPIFSTGIFSRTVVISSTEPTAVIGLIWVDDTNKQAFIYINSWIPYIAG